MILSQTIVTDSATFNADILYLLAKQNLQKGSSSSSSNTLSVSFGPAIAMLAQCLLHRIPMWHNHPASWESLHQALCCIQHISNSLCDKTTLTHPENHLQMSEIQSYFQLSISIIDLFTLLSHVGHLLSSFVLLDLSNLFISSISFLLISSAVTMPW